MLLSGMVALAACGGSQKPAGPPPPTCASLGPATEVALADIKSHAQLTADASAKLDVDMKHEVETICTQDAWAPAPIQCMVDAKTMPALEACVNQLTAPQREHFTGAMGQLVAAATPPPPPTTPTTSPDGSTGVPECDAFMAMATTYMACDKVPAEARDAMKQALSQTAQSFAMLRDPSVPPEARKAAADGCTQGTDALKQSMTAMGCTP